MRRGWLVASGVLLVSGTAWGQRAAFWERVADPHRERVEGLVMRAQAELGDRGPGGASPESLGRAEAWLREALQLDAQNFLATVLLGEAQARQRRGGAAIGLFERARGLARTPGEESWCSLRVAIESSRAGRYAEALSEYDHHIRLGEAHAAAYTNSAEILMALGRLGEAQDRYREAIRLEGQQQPGRERDENLALAFYGLAVALDRDEQTAAAREAIARALALDSKLALLDAARDERSDVFFVPAGDVHYYRGLALMVQGRARDASDAFQRFLTEQSGGRFGRRAEAHLLQLAAGDAPRLRLRLRIAAAATVRSDEAIPAPLIDAAWRGRPALVDACLEEIPAAAREGGRIALDIEFDAAGIPRRVQVKGRDDLAAFAGCAEGRLKAGLRVARSPGGKPASARVELVLAIRR